MAAPAVPDPLRFPVPESFETPRLLLRPFAVADAPQLHEALVESIDALREHLWFLPWVAEPPTRAVALRCGFRLEGVLRHVARSPDGRLRDTYLYAKLPGEK